ncbi:MAG: hypothetical protein Q9228_003205 [Teloschistes exilis]
MPSNKYDHTVFTHVKTAETSLCNRTDFERRGIHRFNSGPLQGQHDKIAECIVECRFTENIACLKQRRANNLIPVFTAPFTASQIREVLDQEKPVVGDEVLYCTTVQPYFDLCERVLFEMDYVMREEGKRADRLFKFLSYFYDSDDFADYMERDAGTAAGQLKTFYETWRALVDGAKKERAEDEKDWMLVDN